VNYSKLVKERFLYLPFYPLPDLSQYVGDIIEVRVASDYLSQSNKAIIEKRIWGSDIYTSDSDVVCILQHSGYFKIKELPPTNIEGVSVFFRVSKGRTTYNSSLKNGIKSKKLNNFQGHSIKPENYCLQKSLGSKNELLEMASRMPMIGEYERSKAQPKKLNEDLNNRDFTLIFNMCFEMWLAYSLSAIADKGRELKHYTSWKLKDKVLYLETNDKRYEISRNISDHTNDDYLFDEFETFRFAEVLSPWEKDNDFMLNQIIIPLNKEYINVIFPRIDWHDIEWAEDSMKIKELEINNLKCFNFYHAKN
jgi:hypothetical protein